MAIKEVNSRILLEEDVIEAVDQHTNEDGMLDDDISCILEEVNSISVIGSKECLENLKVEYVVDKTDDDLISRGTLLAELEKMVPESKYTKVTYLIFDSVKNMILGQTVVCDMGKVIDNIEDLDIYYDNDYFSSNKEKMLLKEEVLDTIRRGGINEN
jgi:hypothetical protein